ncbi:MAG TPA: PD-(D/E)XK nuclease family protein [Mycobacteriales bacterium]
MEQPTLDLPGTPRRLLRATPSRLATFADCPRRYHFAYLQKPAPPRGPAWAHSTLGAAVHLAIRRWYEDPPARRTPVSAGAHLISCWQEDGFRDTVQSARWREKARGWVEAYVSRLDPVDEPLGVERGVATKAAGMALSGRVDRLDDRDGELVVVDYKTSRRPPGADDARSSQQLALYAVAVASMFRRPCTRVELHHLPTGTVISAEHTSESLQRQVDRAGAIAADVVLAEDTLAAGGPVDALFPARPSALCGFCDFRSSCAAGQAYGPAREPWSALGEDDGS